MIRKKVKHIYFKSFIDNADIINTHNYFTSYSEFFIMKNHLNNMSFFFHSYNGDSTRISGSLVKYLVKINKKRAITIKIALNIKNRIV